MALHAAPASNEIEMFPEAIAEYVADLQLHMALQARKLVPTLSQVHDSREHLLQETQATIEKFVSRQVSELVCPLNLYT